MMKPKHWVESRDIHNAHVTETEDIVETVMQSLKIANDTGASLRAHFRERLICRQQLVQHVSKIGLLLPNTFVDFFIPAHGIYSVSIRRVANCVIPILELKLTLWYHQPQFEIEEDVGCLPS